MRILLLLTALLGVLAAPAVTADPRISQLDVRVAGGEALVTFRLADGLDQRIFDRIESGLPTAVLYQLELKAERRAWYDKTLDETELEVVATYDALEREYLVNFRLDGDLVESRMVRDRPALVAAMTRFERLPVFGLAGVPPSARLRVRLRAHLGSKTLFAMIPADVTTEWAESRKFRPS
jgi:hypothetical protein